MPSVVVVRIDVMAVWVEAGDLLMAYTLNNNMYACMHMTSMHTSGGHWTQPKLLNVHFFLERLLQPATQA